MGWMTNEDGLDKCAANYVPLTPLSHLKRAAHVFADVTAVIYGAHRVSYAQYHARCSQLASALVAAGVEPGQVVATILPNIPAQAEAHFGVPACGAVLNTINTRLDVDTVGYILDHGEARVLLVDTQFVDLAEAACATLDGPPPLLIEVPDPAAGFPATGRHTTYDDFIATGDPAFNWIMPDDEWESLALNYTSGTTGRPKGVVYHHLSDDHGHGGQLAYGDAARVHADRTAVSLQRLEPHVDDAPLGGHTGLLPRHHCRCDL